MQKHNSQKTPKTFEERVERLQAIVSTIEKGGVPLEQGVALYKEGLELSKLCREQLDKARHDINLYSEGTEQAFVAESSENGISS